MYALGLLLLAMLTDNHPWQWTAQASVDRSRNELDSVLADIALFREALRDGLLEPVAPPSDLDNRMRGVLEACLSIAPEKRLSAEAVLSTFNL
ncbi:protein kinase, partial [Trypanosoma theileri]